MDTAKASAVAALINERNQLTRRYAAQDIVTHSANFEVAERDGQVVGCVERKCVQWYQWEICHLSVRADRERQGIATELFGRAEATALQSGARVLQCTIREGNVSSEQFFSSRGFQRVARFANRQSGNIVGVWMKVLAPAS